MAEIDFPRQLTAEAIVGYYASTHNDEHRPHLGASLIGSRCARSLWFTFRWCGRKSVDGRLARLFETGHLEEPRMAQNLRAIGVELHTETPEGKQWSVSAVGGHFGGSMDGCGKGFPEGPKTWAVWECKTSGTKAFKQMQADGVMKAKPQHFAQMQVYMGLTGMKRAMYTMVCKETDEIYSEWVHFNEAIFAELMERAERVVKSAEPPIGISQDPSYYECKFCDHRDVCHGAVPEVNCRTCAHSTPEMDGEARWSCQRHDCDIPLDGQRVGCTDHVYIPILLVKHGQQVDAERRPDGGIDVVYTTDDGSWVQGAAGLTSEEMRVVQPGAAVAAYQVKVELQRQGFGEAKVVA